jgi:hypothetical protein
MVGPNGVRPRGRSVQYTPLVRSNAGVRFLESTGVPLGLFPEVSHKTGRAILEPGTLVVMYSEVSPKPETLRRFTASRIKKPPGWSMGSWTTSGVSLAIPRSRTTGHGCC